jgi:hypothetical protein
MHRLRGASVTLGFAPQPGSMVRIVQAGEAQPRELPSQIGELLFTQGVIGRGVGTRHNILLFFA